jgi:hypothetical protein
VGDEEKDESKDGNEDDDHNLNPWVSVKSRGGRKAVRIKISLPS